MERDENGRFVEGNPGGPGRPKGSHSRLSKAYLKALADDFEANGVQTIEILRKERPDVYIGAIGRLMPKIVGLSTDDEGAEVREVIKQYVGSRTDD